LRTTVRSRTSGTIDAVNARHGFRIWRHQCQNAQRNQYVANPKFRSPYGWLVPGLIYFRNRTALNDPRTLSRIFADVFTIQETSLDRLLAPAVVRVDGRNLAVVSVGTLQFGR
jgi:hypothetical protein